MMCKDPHQARDTRPLLLVPLGLLLFALSTAHSSAEAPNEKVWAAQFGGEKLETTIDLSVDELGNTFILGTTKSNLTPEVQGKTILDDYFLTKIDPEGKVLWTRQIPGHGTACSAITVDVSGNVFVAGNTSENMHGQQKIDRIGKDAFVIMFDKEGKLGWTRLFGGFMDDTPTDLACDRLGDIWVTGTTHHLVEKSKGSNDCFLVKIDRGGKIVWKRQFGTDQDETSQAIAIDPLGNCYVTGITKGDLFGKNAGQNQGAKDGYMEGYVARFDLGGRLFWGKQFKDRFQGRVSAIGLDKTGNVYVAGEGMVPVVFGGRELPRRNSTLTKLNAAGQVQWTKGYGG